MKPGADARLKSTFAAIGVPPAGRFTPDPFQLEALAAMESADCLVTAPTGAGKTWIAEQAMAAMLAKGLRSWYASPLKALSNSKFKDFGEIFGTQRVGIVTGDRSENADAPVLVGTTEILRNHLYDSMHQGTSLGVDLVVLDEAHFLGDRERGVVWEEIMIYLPTRITLLMLSATIGNAHQIAAWLGGLRRKVCRVVSSVRRPVPLYGLFLHPSGTLHPLVAGSGRPRLDKKVQAFSTAKKNKGIRHSRKLAPMGEILAVLRKYRLLPALFFLKSRKDCDAALNLSLQNRQPPERSARLAQRIVELVPPGAHIARHGQRRHLETLALGAHHSGQLPAWKLLLETLMSEGLLDAVFATSTVAAGVNFPARTIVMFDSDRFNGSDFLPLTPTEFHQMTGRAGRRGMDNIGFAVVHPGRFMDLRLTARLMAAPPSPVTSQIRIDFSMVLNLLLSHSPEQVQALLERSLAAFQMGLDAHGHGSSQSRAKGAGSLVSDFYRHLEFLQASQYIHADGTLTADGRWASRLRVDHPLLIAEAFRQDLFPSGDPALMAALMAAYVYEKEVEERIKARQLPKGLRAAFRRLDRGLKPFAGWMSSEGFAVRPFHLRPVLSVYAWATGISWERLTRLAEMAEGDLTMLILRTADGLRHIRALEDVFPLTAATAAEALKLVLKDPVV